MLQPSLGSVCPEADQLRSPATKVQVLPRELGEGSHTETPRDHLPLPQPESDSRPRD